MTLQALASHVRTVLAVARRERISVAAAGMSFHAVNAFVPLVLFVVVAASAFGRLATLGRVVELLAGPRAGQVETLLQSLTQQTSGRTLAVVIALGILLWSAVQLFSVSNQTFRAVYGTREQRSVGSRLFDVGVTLLTVVGGAVLAAVLGVTLTFALRGFAVAVLTPIALAALLTVVFLPMYYIFPEPEMTIRRALPGAAFAAVTWTVTGLGLRVYAASSTSVQLYGAVGGLLLLLTWLYVGGYVLMVGVVINAVLSGDVVPQDGSGPRRTRRGERQPGA